MQAVYEKYGASPTSGCLPLLITFPIIIALYRVIYDIPKYIEYVGDLYDKIAQAIMSIDGYEKVFAEFAAENVKTVTYEASDELSSIVNVIKKPVVWVTTAIVCVLGVAAGVVVKFKDKIFK